jgi:hypothetical protein
VRAIERQELAMETLGLNLAEGKSILEGLQDFVVAQQTADDLEAASLSTLRSSTYQQRHRND